MKPRTIILTMIIMLLAPLVVPAQTAYEKVEKTLGIWRDFLSTLHLVNSYNTVTFFAYEMSEDSVITFRGWDGNLRGCNLIFKNPEKLEYIDQHGGTYFYAEGMKSYLVYGSKVQEAYLRFFASKRTLTKSKSDSVVMLFDRLNKELYAYLLEKKNKKKDIQLNDIADKNVFDKTLKTIDFFIDLSSSNILDKSLKEYVFNRTSLVLKEQIYSYPSKKAHNRNGNHKYNCILQKSEPIKKRKNLYTVA